MSNTSAVDTSIHAVSAWFIGNTSHASGDLPETTLRGDGATAPPPETSRSWREIGSGEQQFCPFADTNEHFGRIAQQPRTPGREPRRRGSEAGGAGLQQFCRHGWIYQTKMSQWQRVQPGGPCHREDVDLAATSHSTDIGSTSTIV